MVATPYHLSQEAKPNNKIIAVSSIIYHKWQSQTTKLSRSAESPMFGVGN
jgi:hypothetical protein